MFNHPAYAQANIKYHDAVVWQVFGTYETDRDKYEVLDFIKEHFDSATVTWTTGLYLEAEEPGWVLTYIGNESSIERVEYFARSYIAVFIQKEVLITRTPVQVANVVQP